jgi:TRAP-type C4-dicarboxylate transport system permease small subunit
MAAFFWGTWKQYPINASMTAPVIGIHMNWIYGIGFFTSIGIGATVVARLFRTLTGTIGEDEIRAFRPIEKALRLSPSSGESDLP